MTQNRRIALNIVATYGRSLVSLFCGLFISRWVLAALGDVDFGLYGVVGGLTIFVAFINMLLSQATARFYAFSIGKAKVSAGADGLEECRQWFNTAVVIHTAVPCLLVAAGYPLGVYAVEHWLTIPPERIGACVWVFRYVCIACFVSMVNVPFQAMYTAKQEIAELTIYSFAQTLANVCFMYFMVTHPGDWLEKYALWMCFVSVVPQLFICYRALRVYPECHFNSAYLWSESRFWQLGAFACWQAFGGLGFVLRGQGIQILINKYFGPTINGSMAIATQVSGSAQTLSSALQGAFAPAITNSCGAGEIEQVRILAYRATKFALVLTLVFFLPLAFEIDEVILLWLKTPPDYVTGLCLCMMFMLLADKASIGHCSACNATGRIARYQIVGGTLLISCFPLAWIFLALNLGVYSIGVAMVITTFANTVSRVYFARKLVGMSIRYWVTRIVLPIVFVVVCALPAGYVPRIVFERSFLRICVTTLSVELIFLPLVYLVVLSVEERLFVQKKIKHILRMK